MKHDAENHAKKRLGIDNLLQINCLQLWEARKTGSNGFPAGSGGFPARWRGFRRRSGGFPTGSNAFRITTKGLELPHPAFIYERFCGHNTSREPVFGAAGRVDNRSVSAL